MTADAKKSFMLYFDYRQHLALLNDEERGRLLMALLDYGEKGVEPVMDGALMMAFSFIRAQIDRDAERYEEKCRKRREAGKQGGRPPKSNADDKKQSEAKKANGFFDNQTEAKKPYTETDKETDTDTETDKETDTDTDIKESPYGDSPIPTATPEQTTPYKAIADLYHEICFSFPKLRNVGENRKKAIAARWKEYHQDLAIFRELFARAEASSFLKGKNVRNWSATFDWLMNSANMAKVLEGKYDQEKGGQAHDRDLPPGGAALSGFRMAE